MLVHLGSFLSPDDEIGWHLSPPTPSQNFTPCVYMTLEDGLQGYTDDPKVLDRLAEAAAGAAKSLRIAYGWRECDLCGDVVARVWPKVIPIGGSDCATSETETVDACQGCSGLSDDDVAVEDETINYRAAS